MCCHFNAFLIDQGVTKCDDLSESLIDSFLDVYCKDLRTTSAFYSPRPNAQGLLKRLFVYLIEIKAFNPPRPKAIRKPYSWILDPRGSKRSSPECCLGFPPG
jgi:hypothetical protein